MWGREMWLEGLHENGRELRATALLQNSREREGDQRTVVQLLQKSTKLVRTQNPRSAPLRHVKWKESQWEKVKLDYACDLEERILKTEGRLCRTRRKRTGPAACGHVDSRGLLQMLLKFKGSEYPILFRFGKKMLHIKWHDG